jgi:hypothetical protein
MADLGHDGPPEGFWPDNLLTDEPIERCPIRQLQLAEPALREEVIRWRDLYYPLYKKGHLLLTGGVAEQPARYLEAMQYLEGLDSVISRKFIEIKYPKDKTAP